MTGRHEEPEWGPNTGDEDNAVEATVPTARAVDVSKVVEVKVVATAGVSLVAGIVVAVGSALLADAHILDGLPEWARFLILAAIPPILGFAAGYATPSNRIR